MLVTGKGEIVAGDRCNSRRYSIRMNDVRSGPPKTFNCLSIIYLAVVKFIHDMDILYVRWIYCSLYNSTHSSGIHYSLMFHLSRLYVFTRFPLSQAPGVLGCNTVLLRR